MKSPAESLLHDGKAYRQGEYVAIRVNYQNGCCFQVLEGNPGRHILTCINPQTAVDKVDELHRASMI